VSLTRGDLLIATRSQGKLRELRPLLERAGFTVVGLDEHGIEHEAAEDDLERFETFEENALAKARYFYEVSGGIATVADDSGLVVAALGGAPGVRSKRWSGRADLEGRALDEARGGGGFGYDPYFASGELGGRTFAEAPRDEKERVSHRGRAFRRLLEALRDEAGG
jgi:XTP/dITP diphosphohydrolase